MKEFELLHRFFRWPEPLIDCALGRIKIPVVGWNSPPEWYGFPPALIPILSDGSGPNYLGYWKHWFSNREPTFVQMYVGSGRLVVEIARTAPQFFCYVAMKALTIDEGISPLLKNFASQVGIANLEVLNGVSVKTGDNPQGFSALPQFSGHLPLNSVRGVEQYTGAFPTGKFTNSRGWWENACSFEISREIRGDWPPAISKPPWILPGPKAKIFETLLNQGDLRGAWMTLNSSGWSILDARTALIKLAQVANDPEFSILASAWTAIADPSSGSY